MASKGPTIKGRPCSEAHKILPSIELKSNVPGFGSQTAQSMGMVSMPNCSPRSFRNPGESTGPS